MALTVWYLATRLASTGTGVALVLSAVLLMVELWSVAEVAVVGLLARLGRSTERSGEPGSNPGSDPVAVPIVVTDVGDPEALERTLIAIEAVDFVGRVLVVDQGEDAAIAGLAARLGAEPFPVDAGVGPLDALAEAAEAMFADPTDDADASVIWLRAGQVPAPSFVSDLGARLRSASDVAVVQGAVGLLNRSSLRYVRGGRDDDAILRDVIGPGLSALGAGPWLGPGSMVRVDALRRLVADAGSGVEPGQGQLRLFRLGWRVVFDSRPLTRDLAPHDLDGYLAERRARAARVFGLLRSALGPGRVEGVDLRRRLAVSSLAAPYMAGLRQLVFAAVVLVALVTGVTPHGEPSWGPVALWALWAGGGVLLRRRIVGHSMAIGDWTRQAWRGLECDLSALIKGPERVGPTRAGPGWARLRLLTVLIVVLDVALMARATTGFGAELLPPLDGPARGATVALALLQLVIMVDVAQLVVRRPQRRSWHRFPAGFELSVAGRRAEGIDVSLHGLAALVDDAPPVGSTVVLRLDPPATAGRTADYGPAAPMTANGVVRNARRHSGGRVRLGLELVQVDDDVRRHLVEHCLGEARRDGRDSPAETMDVGAAAVVRTLSDQRMLRSLTGVAAVAAVSVVFYGPNAAPGSAAGIDGGAGEGAAGRPDNVCLASVVGDDVRGEVRIWTDDGWEAAADIDGGGCRSLAADGAAVEIVVDGARFVAEVPAVTDDGILMVAMARVVADGGHDIEWIDQGQGWQPLPEDGIVLPGRLAVRFSDGSVAKLVIEAGEEVAVPSLERKPVESGPVAVSPDRPDSTSTTVSTTTSTTTSSSTSASSSTTSSAPTTPSSSTTTSSPAASSTSASVPTSVSTSAEGQGP